MQIEKAPDIVLEFKLENEAATVNKIVQIHVDHIMKALRLAANDEKTLNDIRQAFICLQWEAEDLIDKVRRKRN